MDYDDIAFGAINQLRDIVKMFASDDAAEDLYEQRHPAFDSLELLEMLEDSYPMFRPPIVGDGTTGFVELPPAIVEKLVLFYAKAAEIINPSVVDRPSDPELIVSSSWAGIKRDALELGNLLDIVIRERVGK